MIVDCRLSIFDLLTSHVAPTKARLETAVLGTRLRGNDAFVEEESNRQSAIENRQSFYGLQ